MHFKCTFYAWNYLGLSTQAEDTLDSVQDMHHKMRSYISIILKCLHKRSCKWQIMFNHHTSKSFLGIISLKNYDQQKVANIAKLPLAIYITEVHLHHHSSQNSQKKKVKEIFQLILKEKTVPDTSSPLIYSKVTLICMVFIYWSLYISIHWSFDIYLVMEVWIFSEYGNWNIWTNRVLLYADPQTFLSSQFLLKLLVLSSSFIWTMCIWDSLKEIGQEDVCLSSFISILPNFKIQIF